MYRSDRVTLKKSVKLVDSLTVATDPVQIVITDPKLVTVEKRQ